MLLNRVPTVVAFLVVSFIALAPVLGSVEGGAATPSLLALSTDPLLDDSMYLRFQKEPGRHVAFDDAGAVSVNQAARQAEATGRYKWFIEQQRYGGDFVQSGVALDDPTLIALGFKLIDWGFERQGEDGGFVGTGDPYHSTSLFLESAARAVLLVKQARRADADAIEAKYAPKLRAAARWMLAPDVVKRGHHHDVPYTHRRYIGAAALGMTAELTGDADLRDAAMRLAHDGIAQQASDGTNPEKGGFDANYQAVGVYFAARYVTVCPDAGLRARLTEMMANAIRRHEAAVGQNGEIDLTGSTRTATEVGRSGKPKTVDAMRIVAAYVYAAKLTGDDGFRSTARRISAAKGWTIAKAD